VVASEARNRFWIERCLMPCKKRRRRCALPAQSRNFSLCSLGPFAAKIAGNMTPEQWTAVDHYFANLLVPPDPALEAALQASAAAGLPPIQVAPNQGKLLQLLAQARGARRILELGTLGGYSTIWLARALPAGGCLITLEMDPKCAEVARANIARAGLAAVVEVRLGRALDILPQLVAEGRGPFDLIFIDADKSRNPDYFPWALKLSRRGTLIIADNVVRKGAVTNATSNDPNVQGVRRFNELLAADPRVSATAIQTVGSKGYDGFVLALVIADP
jgi:predicted O-methyltransferase YrrM